MFFYLAGEDSGLRRQLLRWLPSVLGSTALLMLAAQFEGAARTGCWAAALAVDYVGTAAAGARGWRLPAPGHFAERHGLILIVALGESIVAIGVGVADHPISWAIVLASVLGLVVASAMWWAYFDISAALGEHALADEPAETRPRLGRNAYSFAHLPLMAGVVLVALGMKKVLEYVSDIETHTLTDPLKGVALAALFWGPVSYLLGHVAFKWLTTHQISVVRLVTAGLLLLGWLVAASVRALAQLAVVAAILAGAVAVETILYAEHRRQVRAELTDA
jgi:low temperature requirement protein LtrA